MLNCDNCGKPVTRNNKNTIKITKHIEHKDGHEELVFCFFCSSKCAKEKVNEINY